MRFINRFTMVLAILVLCEAESTKADTATEGEPDQEPSEASDLELAKMFSPILGV